MPADVKWTYCLTGSSQDFTSVVCGFFSDRCNSFYISQVYSNRSSFLDGKHQKIHGETWAYCTGSLHRWLCAAHLQRCCCFMNKQLHWSPQKKLCSVTGPFEVLSGAAGQTQENKEGCSRATWLGYCQCNFIKLALKRKSGYCHFTAEKSDRERLWLLKVFRHLLPTLQLLLFHISVIKAQRNA